MTARVFISYAHEDADWVRVLAQRLEGSGVGVYFDEWDLRPGAVVVHELGEAIRRSGTAIQVLSPASVAKPWVREEFAALLHESIERGLRFIPVLHGDVEVPPFAASRVWLDFRAASAREYDDKVAELVRAVRCEPHPRGGGPGTAAASGPGERAVAGPPPYAERAAFVICHAPADAGYAARLGDRLCAAGLPVWSVADLLPGDDPVRVVAQRLGDALAVVVLMSPQSQASDEVTRMVLEGQQRSRPFFPILLRGERHYLLAATSYVDARTADLPTARELAVLQRLHERHLAQDADPMAPVPVADVPATTGAPVTSVPVTRIPVAVALRGLAGRLEAAEFEHADLVTTALLLEAAGRLADGWMRRRDARDLSDDVLAGVDQLWTRFSGGRHGFSVQRALVPVLGTRHADFLRLSVSLGWRTTTADPVPIYRDFVRAGAERPGFFPTLRNPQTEKYLDWYDQWVQTALAVHLRLRTGQGPRSR